MPSQLPTDRPFSTKEAVQLGVNRERLSMLVRRGLLVRKSRGWYQHPDAQPEIAAQIASALAELQPQVASRLVVGHASAARLHGMRTPRLHSSEQLIFICRPNEQQPDYRPGLIVLPAGLTAADVATVQGLRVTSVARTALDLSRGLALEHALVSIDHALAMGVSTQELREARVRMHRWPGARSLDAAIERGDGLAESPLESMSRGAMIRAGLPTPQLQPRVQGASGQWWRPDFCWSEQRVIGEADGHSKYATRTEHVKEKFRDEDLRGAGWQVVHWTYEQMLTAERPAITWLARALHLQPTPLHRHSSGKRRRGV